MTRSYAAAHAELREGRMALARATDMLPVPGLVETLVETLIWVRENYPAGNTQKINARIDAAIARAVGIREKEVG